MQTEVMSQQKTDEKYMRRCIQLARNGLMGAAPNPMVGSVIVCDDRIIGEGYHRRCGGPHAEVNAVNSVREPELLCRSTIYVSLEPCAHWGKTPPCAQLIIDKQIPRIVVGCQDPFAKVDGQGIQMLRDAGREVKVGVLEQECLALNYRFITRHTHNRPHITLKWAQSSDGFIDAFRLPEEGKAPVVISTPNTRALVHKLRAESDAILVGARTALLDNPSLTTREWDGPNPLRLVMDLRGNLPRTLRLFDGSVPTRAYVLDGNTPTYADKVQVVPVKVDDILGQIMADLVEQNVQSLIVEGGAVVLQTFIDAGLWDECRVEISPLELGKGVAAPRLKSEKLIKTSRLDGHEILIFAQKL